LIGASQIVAMTGARPYVASMTPTPPTTAEQLLRTRLPDKRVELVHGVLVVREPPGCVTVASP
jgi:hypothetical protein